MAYQQDSHRSVHIELSSSGRGFVSEGSIDYTPEKGDYHHVSDISLKSSENRTHFNDTLSKAIEIMDFAVSSNSENPMSTQSARQVISENFGDLIVRIIGDDKIHLHFVPASPSSLEYEQVCGQLIPAHCCVQGIWAPPLQSSPQRLSLKRYPEQVVVYNRRSRLYLLVSKRFVIPPGKTEKYKEFNLRD